MIKMKSMSIGEFMSGDYKTKKKRNRSLRLAASSVFPLTLFPAMASANGAAVPAITYPTAIPVGASEWMSEKALETLAHALDPLVDLMVALSFPVASVIIIGGCFFFMLGKSERAWSTIQNAGLGYVLIQIMPLLLNVLKEVGGAI